MSAGGIMSFSDFCETSGMPLVLRDALIEELNNRQSARLAVANASAQRRAGSPERAPLIDAQGQEFGVVEASIPRESFFYWANRLGPECWEDETFRREYLRDNAHARVRTVSARCTVRQSIAMPWRGEVRSVNKYAASEQGREEVQGLRLKVSGFDSGIDRESDP
jgi:hypothetical protein